jgi:hypothetical protein
VNIIDTPSVDPQRRAHPGPPLIALAIVFVVLFLGSLVAGTVLAGTFFPSPFAPAQQIQDYFTTQHTAVRISAFLQFGAAVPLLIFTATASSRLRYLGVQAAGTTIALVGGILASAFLSLCALFGWVLSRPDVVNQPSLVRALHDLAFLAGGPAHVVALGLLVAGIAVTSGFAGLLPRWMAWVGVAIAVAAELSTLTLVLPAAAILLPLARFTSFVWIIAVGALLPRSR